mgnify:FL=1|tara:strand:- start:815 stop:1138 length:324 start_codon:yes stop_codon:yes gene_type:complete
MEPQITFLMKDMTNDEKMLFLTEYSSEKKDVTIGVVLALFLGGFGAHKFYFGQIGLGIIYFLFCWTFIPSLIGLVEACLMGGTTRAFNNQIARRAYENIRYSRKTLR